MNDRLRALTVSEASELIIEAFEEELELDEIHALALLLVDSRRMKPELKLAVPYAAQWVYENRPQGWQVVRWKMWDYRRILNSPSQAKVYMLPAWERARLLIKALKKRGWIDP